jgi:Purine nucleoside phosphorylase
MGADIVGMTIVPEAILCRERALCYAALCVVTNYAEGTIEYIPNAGTEGLVPMSERAQRNGVHQSVIDVLTKAVENLPASRSCLCKASLEEAFLDGSLPPKLVRFFKKNEKETKRSGSAYQR